MERLLISRADDEGDAETPKAAASVAILERVAALDADIAWFAAEGEPTPAVGKPGADYVEVLRGIETGSPAFVCHFYNQYFAHTAGGLMIGKKMSDALLDGRTLAKTKACSWLLLLRFLSTRWVGSVALRSRCRP